MRGQNVMTIYEALKNDGDYSHARVSCGDRWLCWYEEQWTVFEHKHRARSTTIVIQTDDESDAVKELISR